MTGTDNGKTGPASLTVNAAAATQLVFTTAPQTTKVGMPSGVITVAEEDAFGNAVIAAADLPVTLSSSNVATGTFFQSDGVTPLTSPKIANGGSSLSFTYVDTLTGTPTLTAHASGLTDGTQVEAVTT